MERLCFFIDLELLKRKLSACLYDSQYVSTFILIYRYIYQSCASAKCWIWFFKIRPDPNSVFKIWSDQVFKTWSDPDPVFKFL